MRRVDCVLTDMESLVRGDAWILGSCNFEIDDGSLPAIELIELGPQDIATIFAKIMTRGQLNEGACLYDNRLQADTPVGSLPEAAKLVAAGAN